MKLGGVCVLELGFVPASYVGGRRLVLQGVELALSYRALKTLGK